MNPTLLFLIVCYFCYSAVELDDKKMPVDVQLPFNVLQQTTGDEEVFGRVSTGTKFALEEWLKLDKPPKS